MIFLVGLFLGAFVGFFIAALCAARKLKDVLALIEYEIEYYDQDGSFPKAFSNRIAAVIKQAEGES